MSSRTQLNGAVYIPAFDTVAIVRANRRRRIATTLIAVIVILLVVAVVSAYREAKKAVAQGTSYRNMISLANGLDWYAQDNDGHLPPMRTMEEARKALADYSSGSIDQWYSPGLNTAFAINQSLSQRSLKSLPDAGKIIALWDTRVYDGKHVAAFANGSARVVSEPEWSQLRALSGIKDDNPAPHEPWR